MKVDETYYALEKYTNRENIIDLDPETSLEGAFSKAKTMGPKAGVGVVFNGAPFEKQDGYKFYECSLYRDFTDIELRNSVDADKERWLALV